MPDRVSVTTRQGWGSRLSESIKSVRFGVVLFGVAFPLLFWNEGRVVRTAKSLEEGAGVVVSAGADSVSASNEGKLVHVSGFTKTDEVLDDEVFGISENAIQLVRATSRCISGWRSRAPRPKRSSEEAKSARPPTTTTRRGEPLSSTLRHSRAPEGTRTLAPFPTIRVG